MTTRERVPRGREGEARRNDGRILEAALDVLSADPTAPMSAVGRHAGVGQATLYRRYPSRQALLEDVCRRGLTRIAEAARAAAEAPDAWTGLTDFLRWYVESGTLRMGTLLGSYDPPAELFELASTANRDIQSVVERAVAAGALRADVTGADLTLAATALGALSGRDAERTRRLRQRHLELLLQALARTDGDPLPGPPPDADELERPWHEANPAQPR